MGWAAGLLQAGRGNGAPVFLVEVGSLPIAWIMLRHRFI